MNGNLDVDTARHGWPSGTLARAVAVAIAVVVVGVNLLLPAVGSASQRGAAPQAPAARPAAGDAVPAGDAVKGKQTFARVGCYQCHGREAQGSPTTGPRLGPSPLPFRAFDQYVRSPRGQMPPYTRTILPDQDLADIYAFARAQPPAAVVDRTLLP